MALLPAGGVYLCLLLSMACLPMLGQSAPQALTSLRDIRNLSDSQAANAIPVDFQATVTYYRSYEKTLFVQDGAYGIQVLPSDEPPLSAGDRVQIQGVTRKGHRPAIESTSIKVIGHGALPAPVPATIDELADRTYDARLVTVFATVSSADTVTTSGVRSTLLQLHTEGGNIDALVDTDNNLLLHNLLDAQVAVTGVDSGRDDEKIQQAGLLLHVSSMSDVKVVAAASADPWSLPVTPMDETISAYHVKNFTHRIRVHGTVTYFEPGAAAVLQNGTQSLWINTLSTNPIPIGETADAIGFPDINNGMLSLSSAQIRDAGVSAPVTPTMTSYDQLASGKHLFELVMIEGKVVAQVRGVDKDEYVLSSNGNLFSAIFRYANIAGGSGASSLKDLAEGATVKVTGICILNSPNTYDKNSSFSILLRTPDDINVVGKPPLLSINNLSRLVTLLIVVVLGVALWGTMLRRRVHQQTVAITERAEQEASEERRNMQLEQWRSRILEDINSSQPLGELVENICAMVSFNLHGAPCWCEVIEDTRLGRKPASTEGLRILSHEILARSGAPLGHIYTAFEQKQPPTEDESLALATGARLAMLAIETRKLYSDLLYRSEFDLLTDAYNRFSLQRLLEQLIEESDSKTKIFGLIYVDLDDFKQINDVYGHHVGDLYLREVAMRMRRQLRSDDMLARIGGDEFAALVPVVRSLAQIEEIAMRMERCFDAPFNLEGYNFRGGASVGYALYPKNGTTAEELLKAADSAMYATKNARKEARAATVIGGSRSGR
ncbi:MAG: GGDEF domain-containing protein [Acidobacteriota bacterium]|nr:GGDEF domain-containing protein [Acidobacteriota bacterium]